MKSTVKKLIGICLVIMSIFLLVACSDSNNKPESGQKPDESKKVVKFAISHCQPLDDPFQIAYLDMEKYLEDTGRFDVTIYANSEFSASEGEAINQVISNVVQMSQAPSFLIGTTAGVKEFFVYDFPSVFKTVEDYEKIINSDLSKELAEKVKQKTGLVLGRGWPNGWMATGANKSIKTADDLKGLKLRTPQTEATLAYMKELGVNAIPMSFSEVYTGVQQGTIDGVCTPIRFFASQKFAEVANNIMWDKSAQIVQLPFVNGGFYDSLDEEAKDILIKGMDLFTDNVQKYAEEQELLAVEKLKTEYGIDVVMPDQATMDKFEAAGKKVFEANKSIIGEDFSKKVIELLEK